MKKLTPLMVFAVLIALALPSFLFGVSGLALAQGAGLGAAVMAAPYAFSHAVSNFSWPATFLLQSGKAGSEYLDANEAAFFTRQTEHVKAQAYDVVYPELPFASGSIIPISTEAGPGAETIVYYQFDQVGLAKVIASYADDLPRADIFGKQFISAIRSIGNSFAWSLQEIRTAAMAKRPLSAMKAKAARRAFDQLVNKIATIGDAASGLLGFFNNPNVTHTVLPADGTGASTLFANKTPDQILRDLNTIANAPFITSKGVEQADTMLMPLATYTLLSTTARSATTDTTILEYFLKQQQFIKKVVPINEATGAGTVSVGSNVIVAYKNSSDKLTLEIPQPFEQLPVQQQNLEYKVPCHGRIGGVLIYYPLSVNIGEGV